MVDLKIKIIKQIERKGIYTKCILYFQEKYRDEFETDKFWLKDCGLDVELLCPSYKT